MGTKTQPVIELGKSSDAGETWVVYKRRTLDQEQRDAQPLNHDVLYRHHRALRVYTICINFLDTHITSSGQLYPICMTSSESSEQLEACW